MKLLLTTLLVISCSVFQLKAQIFSCHRPVDSFQMAPGGYNIYGAGLLVADSANCVLGFFSNFSTVNGPDLHVFLSDSFLTPDNNNLNKVDLGLLQSTSGQQSYSVPQGITLDTYNWVLIYSVSSDHFWGGGLLGEKEGNCLSGMSEIVSTHPLQIFSSKGTITIHHLPKSVNDIIIFNLVGVKIFGYPDKSVPFEDVREVILSATTTISSVVLEVVRLCRMSCRQSSKICII